LIADPPQGGNHIGRELSRLLEQSRCQIRTHVQSSKLRQMPESVTGLTDVVDQKLHII
jgi:hypothetical protein